MLRLIGVHFDEYDSELIWVIKCRPLSLDGPIDPGQLHCVSTKNEGHCRIRKQC